MVDHPTERLAARLLGRLPAGPVADALLALTDADELATAEVAYPAPPDETVRYLGSVPARTAVTLATHLTDPDAITALAFDSRRKTVREAARRNPHLPDGQVAAAIRAAGADGQGDTAWKLAARLVSSDPETIVALRRDGVISGEGRCDGASGTYARAIRALGSDGVLAYCDGDERSRKVTKQLVHAATAREADATGRTSRYTWPLTDEALFALASVSRDDDVGRRLLSQVGADVLARHPHARELMRCNAAVRTALVARSYVSGLPATLDELAGDLLPHALTEDLLEALVGHPSWAVNRAAVEVLTHPDAVRHSRSRALYKHEGLFARMTPDAVGWLDQHRPDTGLSDEALDLRLYRTGHAPHLRERLIRRATRASTFEGVALTPQEVREVVESARLSETNARVLVTGVSDAELTPWLAAWQVCHSRRDLATLPAHVLTSEFAREIVTWEGSRGGHHVEATLEREPDASFTDDDVRALVGVASWSVLRRPGVLAMLLRRGLLEDWAADPQGAVVLGRVVAGRLAAGDEPAAEAVELTLRTLDAAQLVALADGDAVIHRHLVDRLGDRPALWAETVAMLPDWAGTLPELVDVVETLAAA